jgi:hypothetical protein
VSSAILKAAIDAAEPQIQIIIDEGRKEFIALFGNYVKVEDCKRLEELFINAAKARAGQFTAQTAEQAADFEDEYEAALESIETIGDAYEIVGKAKAGVFARHMAHMLIAGAFAVAGSVLQVGLGIVIPGLGVFVGAAVNAGVQHVVSAYLGDV